MEKDIYWDVFRDTGDPLCWLMTRAEDAVRTEKTDAAEQREDRPSAPG